MNYKQFEIYDVNLNPTKGSEQKGVRPCVILQTNAVSDLGKTTLIAPITSRKVDKIYPYEVHLKADNKNNLRKDSKIKFDQIRVIDKTRIHEKIGYLEKTSHEKTLKALDIIFDREGYFRNY